MYTAEFFIKGLIVGFVIAAPVGPVAVMCIHRTLTHGRLAGYVCGLGATIADTIFGAVAALGLGFVASFLMAHHDWLRIGGGALLVALGLKLALSRHLPPAAEKQEEMEERSERLQAKPQGSKLDFHIANFVTAFLIMITNPITLVSFAAIFAVVDIADIGDYTRWIVSLIGGVFAGAALWWSSLVLVSGALRHRINAATILWINRVSGGLILVFGVILLLFPASLQGKIVAPPTAALEYVAKMAII